MNVKRNTPYAKNGRLLEALLNKQRNKKMNQGGVPNSGGVSDLLDSLGGMESYEERKIREDRNLSRLDNFDNIAYDYNNTFTPEEKIMARDAAGLADFDPAFLSPKARRVAGSLTSGPNKNSTKVRRMLVRFLQTDAPEEVVRAVYDNDPNIMAQRAAYYASQNPDSALGKFFQDQEAMYDENQAYRARKKAEEEARQEANVQRQLNRTAGGFPMYFPE